MYGTVAKVRVKPGHEEQLEHMLEQWNRDRRPQVPGVVADYTFRLDRDPQELMLVAVFKDRKTFRTNAEDPEQDRWYRQMREHLESDPEWNDGEVIGS